MDTICIVAGAGAGFAILAGRAISFYFKGTAIGVYVAGTGVHFVEDCFPSAADGGFIQQG